MVAQLSQQTTNQISELNQRLDHLSSSVQNHTATSITSLTGRIDTMRSEVTDVRETIVNKIEPFMHDLTDFAAYVQNKNPAYPQQT